MFAGTSLDRGASSGLAGHANRIEDMGSAVIVFGPVNVSQELNGQIQGRKYSALPGS
jgi:hypothetical protein